MKFADKLKKARREKGITQLELAQLLDVSLRTITGYETEGIYPKKREIYEKLAKIFDKNESYFKNEEEEFVLKASDKYGSSGKKQAENLVNQISGLFAGGELDEEDKDAVVKALMDAYWQSKKENSKYNKKD